MVQPRVDENGVEWGWWGSCQYDAAKKVYDQVAKAYQEGGVAQVRTMTGLEVVPEKLPLELDLVTELKKELDEESGEGDEKYGASPEQMVEIVSLKAFLDEAADSAWDLWSAAGAVLDRLLVSGAVVDKGEEGSPIEEALKGTAEGWPILNQLIQEGESMTTGFVCWFMNQFYGVSEEHFGGFDT